MNQKTDADVIIVGGGHAGLIQTLFLAQNGLKVICIDRDQITDRADERTTAISYGSHQLMKAVGVWDALLPHACPIQDIKILDGSSPVLLDFNVDDIQNKTEAPAFGWILENHIIRKALHEAVQKEKMAQHKTGHSVKDFQKTENAMQVILESGEILTASLVIGADGRQSFTREWMNVATREWSYDQKAVVSIVTHENPHHNIAVEHFKAEGPFAILPMLDDSPGGHRSSIVWTTHQGKNNLMELDEETFITALNSQFPDSYGAITKVGKRLSYPLNFVHAYDYVVPRMALIADAAHGIHPIAGQGLNIGLRDVAALGELLIQAKEDKKDIGSIDILKQYQKIRRPDNIAMAASTDFLNKIFSNNILPMRLSRKIGLKMIDRFKPAKDFFMKQAMGSAGHLPKTMQSGKTKS